MLEVFWDVYFTDFLLLNSKYLSKKCKVTAIDNFITAGDFEKDVSDDYTFIEHNIIKPFKKILIILTLLFMQQE